MVVFISFGINCSRLLFILRTIRKLINDYLVEDIVNEI